MNNNNYCIIMAGGVGSRFWPISRTKRPKQFLDILGTGQTLIQQTFDRMSKICPRENIYIVTNRNYENLTYLQLPDVDKEQILFEPTRRNTAPCIAYANEKIRNQNPNANIVVAPSDHLILKEEEFRKVIDEGLEFVAKNDALLTIGIKPTKPETGYGYIQIEDPENIKKINKVKTFTEKPDYEIAKFFVESGEFFWNSGIFTWSLKSITKAFELYQPDILELFTEDHENLFSHDHDQFIQQVYGGCKNISIDYGVMEKADNVFVYCADFGWSDLGTWDSVFNNYPKDSNTNAINNDNILTYETNNTIITGPKKKLIAVHGLDGYVVVDTEDALLICKRSEEDKLREIVNDIKFKKGDEYI